MRRGLGAETARREETALIRRANERRPRARPGDPAVLAGVALRRQPQRSVGARRRHTARPVLVASVVGVGGVYSGGVERGLPNRGLTTGGVPPVPPMPNVPGQNQLLAVGQSGHTQYPSDRTFGHGAAGTTCE